jgi:hypothetical protein
VSRAHYYVAGSGRPMYWDPPDDIADDEDEREIPDPDEITDWTQPETDRSPTMGIQNYDDVAGRYTPEEMAEAVANLDAELKKARTELAQARAQQPAPELTVEEATAQIEAIPRLVQDGSGRWIENPELHQKMLDLARKAGADMHLRRGGSRR